MRWSLTMAGAVLRHPGLWPIAVRQLRRSARRDWWRRPPFLPVPSADYVGFRLITQYGDPAAQPAAEDVVAYLRWCRDWPAP
ncbi:MAG TPA: hypothetical protein VFO97_03365 [Desertimonas sp.]|nr:hypothetical protein [Desertimonas sp.]